MRNQLIPDAIDIDGKAVFFMQSGPRESEHVLLILHGFMSDYRSLQLVAEDLALDNKTTLLLPDLPGFGSSDALGDDEPNLEQYVDWVGTFLDTVAPAAKHVTVMGYSFGCYIAIEFAARHPKRLERLVLLMPVIKVAAAVRIYTAGLETLADLSLDATRALYRWRPHFDLTNLYLARSRHPERVIRMLKHRRGDLARLEPKVILGLTSDLLSTDLLELAPEVKASVFTIMAKDDAVAVNSATDKFMELVQARGKEIYTMPKSGHMVPFEEPELVVNVLNEHFFDGVPSSK